MNWVAFPLMYVHAEPARVMAKLEAAAWAVGKPVPLMVTSWPPPRAPREGDIDVIVPDTVTEMASDEYPALVKTRTVLVPAGVWGSRHSILVAVIVADVSVSKQDVAVAPSPKITPTGAPAEEMNPLPAIVILVPAVIAPDGLRVDTTGASSLGSPG